MKVYYLVTVDGVDAKHKQALERMITDDAASLPRRIAIKSVKVERLNSRPKEK